MDMHQIQSRKRFITRKTMKRAININISCITVNIDSYKSKRFGGIHITKRRKNWLRTREIFWSILTQRSIKSLHLSFYRNE